MTRDEAKKKAKAAEKLVYLAWTNRLDEVGVFIFFFAAVVGRGAIGQGKLESHFAGRGGKPGGGRAPETLGCNQSG